MRPGGAATVTGPHCTDHSARGLRLGRAGPTAKYFLVHAPELIQRRVGERSGGGLCQAGAPKQHSTRSIPQHVPAVCGFLGLGDF